MYPGFLEWRPFPVSLEHGAVYQLGMHRLVPRKLENMDLTRAQECQAFFPRRARYIVSGSFLCQLLELLDISKVPGW